MTDDEVFQIMFRIRASSPLMSKVWDKNPEMAHEIWIDGIGDLPYETVVGAVKQWIQENQQPPTIADLRSLCAARLLKLPTPGSALAIASAWVQNGEVGKCPKVIMYALDKIGKPRQVRALSKFAFEKAFQEVWTEVEKEAKTMSLQMLPHVANGDMRQLPNSHLSLEAGESHLPKLEDA